MAKTFKTNEGVNSFETGGPNGLITVTSERPFTTDNGAEISILETDGRHAVTGEEPREVREVKQPDPPEEKKGAAAGSGDPS